MSYPNTSGTAITVSDFNDIRTTVNDVLGLGSNGYGYPNLNSRDVSTSTVIRAVDWQALIADIDVVATHQSNITTSTTVIAQTTATADKSNTLYNYAQYLSQEPHRYIAHPTQLNPKDDTNGRSTSSGIWSVLTQVTKASWPTTLIARYFFNAGGKIQVNSSHLNNSTGTVATVWKNLINGLGTYTYSRNEFINHVTTGTTVTAAPPYNYIQYKVTATRGDDLKSVTFRVDYITTGSDFLVSPDAATWYIDIGV